MHRLAVVPQSLLRKPFRVANSFGTFRPGVAVTVERDAKLLAPLLKLRGAVAGAHAGQITGPSAAVAEFGRGGCLGAASLISPG